MTQLCALCSKLPFVNLPPFPDWLNKYHVPLKADDDLVPYLPDREEGSITKDNPHGVAKTGSLGIAHHQTFEALQEAAKSCDVCFLIEQSVQTVRDLLEEANKDPRYVYYNKAGPPKYEFSITGRHEDEEGLLVWSLAEDESEVYLMAAIGYCVDDGTCFSSRQITMLTSF